MEVTPCVHSQHRDARGRLRVLGPSGMVHCAAVAANGLNDLVSGQHDGTCGRGTFYRPQAWSRAMLWLRAALMTSYAASTMAHAGAALFVALRHGPLRRCGCATP